MSDHDEHSSFIKTPQQLIVVILAAFLVPIIGIIMLVQLVTASPSADPAALQPEKVAEHAFSTFFTCRVKHRPATTCE